MLSAVDVVKWFDFRMNDIIRLKKFDEKRAKNYRAKRYFVVLVFTHFASIRCQQQNINGISMCWPAVHFKQWDFMTRIQKKNLNCCLLLLAASAGANKEKKTEKQWFDVHSCRIFQRFLWFYLLKMSQPNDF